jgi:hypothetical protein
VASRCSDRVLDVGDRERTDGFTVITAAQGDETLAQGLALIAPVVEAHLQRDFDGTGAVVCIEHPVKPRGCRLHQLLGQRDRRFMGHSSQHDVVDAIKLVLERGNDARMAMAKQTSPPRAHRIQIEPALGVGEPRTLRLRNGQHRHAFMVVHLRARVPDHGKVARGQWG